MRPVVFNKERLARFIWLCHERYQIKLRKEAGEPQPWTADPILQRYHFCNVHSYDDKTSRAIHALINAQEEPRRRVAAAIMGRYVNKASSIAPCWEVWRSPTGNLADAIRKHGLNANAYKIHTPKGLFQPDGVALAMEGVTEDLCDRVTATTDMPSAIKVLRELHGTGGFNGYLIALDLLRCGHWSPTFNGEYAFMGPGAYRGACHISGDDVKYIRTDERASSSWRQAKGGPEVQAWGQRFMRSLARKVSEGWPPSWQPFTIHESEFMLCEHDKHVRKQIAGGSGRLYQGCS